MEEALQNLTLLSSVSPIERSLPAPTGLPPALILLSFCTRPLMNLQGHLNLVAMPTACHHRLFLTINIMIIRVKSASQFESVFIFTQTP